MHEQKALRQKKLRAFCVHSKSDRSLLFEFPCPGFTGLLILSGIGFTGLLILSGIGFAGFRILPGFGPVRVFDCPGPGSGSFFFLVRFRFTGFLLFLSFLICRLFTRRFRNFLLFVVRCQRLLMSTVFG